MENKQLICSLIKDDLTNSRLVNGLNQLGLDSSEYFLHLSETIFQRIGFENSHHTDEVYAHYMDLTRKANALLPKANDEALGYLAEEIYQQLLNFKTPVYEEA
jgi:phosphatidylinositol kinase/protein kinase (PI-3  family)